MVFLQCFIVSTVNALQTPMINASMVIVYIIFLAALYLILSFFFFSYIASTRFYVTDILVELTTLLAELVELQSP